MLLHMYTQSLGPHGAAGHGTTGSPGRAIGPGCWSRRNGAVWIDPWMGGQAVGNVAHCSGQQASSRGRRSETWYASQHPGDETTLDCGAACLAWAGGMTTWPAFSACARRRRRRPPALSSTVAVAGDVALGCGQLRDGASEMQLLGLCAKGGGRRAQRPQEGGVALRYRLPPTAHRPSHRTAPHRTAQLRIPSSRPLVLVQTPLSSSKFTRRAVLQRPPSTDSR